MQAADGSPMPTKQMSSLPSARAAATVIISAAEYAAAVAMASTGLAAARVRARKSHGARLHHVLVESTRRNVSRSLPIASQAT